MLGIRELTGKHDQGFSTVAGFVVSQLGRIPSEGDHFTAQGRRYEVVDMDGNRVDKVLVSNVPPVSGSKPEDDPVG
ncbi:MAG: transporter associated domain-containing protein [Paludibaculum sp.]